MDSPNKESLGFLRAAASLPSPGRENRAIATHSHEPALFVWEKDRVPSSLEATCLSPQHKCRGHPHGGPWRTVAAPPPCMSMNNPARLWKAGLLAETPGRQLLCAGPGLCSSKTKPGREQAEWDQALGHVAPALPQFCPTLRLLLST